MERKMVVLPENAFQPRLLKWGWIFCLLGLVCGLFPVLALGEEGYRRILLQKLLTSGIASRSAMITWSIINGVISVLCVICPGLLAMGLTASLRGEPARGFGFLSAVGTWGVRIVKGTGIALAALYVCRMVLYIIDSLQNPQGMMLIYSMLLMEGLMGVIAWAVYRCVRSFVEGFGDTMASMAYTCATGRIDNQSIPVSAERGFLVLGIVCPLCAVSQVVTMTAVVTRIRSYYAVVLATHPMEWLTAATLVCSSVASILMWQYLRRYNRICEWEKYQASKQK